MLAGSILPTFFYSTPLSDYKNTKWTIWQGDPLNGGILKASGVGGSVSPSNVVATSGSCGLLGSACTVVIPVSLGTSVFLPSGFTYYLGTQNTFIAGAPGSDQTNRVFSNGPNAGWESSNNAIGSIGSTLAVQGCTTITNTVRNGCSTGDTAFDIIGAQAPEPGTLVLMTLALAGLGFKFRRRNA